MDPRYLDYCTSEDQRATVEAVIEHGSNRKAANALGKHPSTIDQKIQRIKKRAAKSGFAPDAGMLRPVAEGFEVRSYSNMARNADGDPIWIKADRTKEDIAKQMAAAVEGFKKDLPEAKPVPAIGEFAHDLMAGYPVGDHHFGMLAWHEDAGGDYDLKIGEQLLVDSMVHLIGVAPRCHTALIALVGDFFHYDSKKPVTPTSGHILDSDSRPAKMIRVAIRTIRAMVAKALEHHNEVRLIIETGNHDMFSSDWAREFFNAFYENEPRVTVDVSPRNFHYFRFGKNLIGTHHGDKRIKPESMAVLMADDRPEDWAATEHRTWWTGHVHHDQVKDFVGARWESFKILPPADEHAQSSGYRSKRGGQCIVMHRELGEVARHTVTPEMLKCPSTQPCG